MRVLVLHTPKGGSGKSTLSRELAVAAGSGVALCDLDPQGTTRGWYSRRDARTPLLIEPDALRDLPALAKARIKLLVVDTAPGQPAGIAGLLRQATAVLVPVRPSPDDLLAAAPIAESLAGHPRWAFVLTQAPQRSRLAAQAIRALAALGRLAPVSIGFRADFPASAVDGRAAVEFPGTRAAEEVRGLAAYVNKLMEGA